MITNRRIRLIGKLLLAGAMLTVAPGCWDNKDINHRALPIAMGLEDHDGGYKIYLLVPDNRQNRTSVKVVSGSGKTMNEIVDRIGTDMEMKIDLLHLKVVVFDRAIAERGLRDSVSSFIRSRDVSTKTIVAISEGDVKSMFENLSASSTSSGMEIYDYFEKSAGWTPQVAQTHLWQIFRSLTSYTRDVVVPLIEKGETTVVDSKGSAVIKNGKMVGRITPEETLLFNAFNGESTQGEIEVMDHAAVLIVGDRLTHSSSLEGDVAVVNSRLNLEVSVLETRGTPTPAMIRQELDEVLTEKFQAMFRSVQAEEADILGLGQLFRTRIPRERLKHWRSDYYPHMKFRLQVHTIIRNEGLLKMKE